MTRFFMKPQTVTRPTKTFRSLERENRPKFGKFNFQDGYETNPQGLLICSTEQISACIKIRRSSLVPKEALLIFMGQTANHNRQWGRITVATRSYQIQIQIYTYIQVYVYTYIYIYINVHT